MSKLPWKQNPPKPQKRHPALHPLSHEHHQGLTVSLRLFHGGQKSVEPSILRKYILGFWEDQLQTHFLREEELFGIYANQKHPLYIQFLNEHQSIREEIDWIQKEHYTNSQKYHLFAKKLRDHIRFEERKLFPWLQLTLTEQELTHIAEGLEGVKEKCYVFTPTFWL